VGIAQPSLRGLLSLVTCFLELQTVSLPLDARHVPEIRACETNFTCLIVPESPIDQARPVAEFLHRYLPSVTAVDAMFMEPFGTNVPQIMPYKQAWQEVGIHMNELRSSDSESVELEVWTTHPLSME